MEQSNDFIADRLKAVAQQRGEKATNESDSDKNDEQKPVANKTPESSSQQTNTEQQQQKGENKSSEAKAPEASSMKQPDKSTPEQNSPLTDEVVFKYLSEKLGKENISSYDDLVQTKEIEKIVEKEIEKPIEYSTELSKTFDKYQKDTGRGIEDFYKLQKDYSEATDMDVVRESLRIKNPNFNSDDINDLYNDRYGVDQDVDSDADARRKELALKADSNEARSFLAANQEKYKAPLENSNQSFEAKQKEFQAQQEESAKQWREAAEIATKDFKDFSFKNVDGGDFTFKPNEQSLGEVKQIVADNNVLSLYANEQGLIDLGKLNNDLVYLKNKDAIHAEIAKQNYEAGREAEIKNKVNPNTDTVGKSAEKSNKPKSKQQIAAEARNEFMKSFSGRY